MFIKKTFQGIKGLQEIVKRLNPAVDNVNGVLELTIPEPYSVDSCAAQYDIFVKPEEAKESLSNVKHDMLVRTGESKFCVEDGHFVTYYHFNDNRELKEFLAARLPSKDTWVYVILDGETKKELTRYDSFKLFRMYVGTLPYFNCATTLKIIGDKVEDESRVASTDEYPVIKKIIGSSVFNFNSVKDLKAFVAAIETTDAKEFILSTIEGTFRNKFLSLRSLKAHVEKIFGLDSIDATIHFIGGEKITFSKDYKWNKSSEVTQAQKKHGWTYFSSRDELTTFANCISSGSRGITFGLSIYGEPGTKSFSSVDQFKAFVADMVVHHKSYSLEIFGGDLIMTPEWTPPVTQPKEDKLREENLQLRCEIEGLKKEKAALEIQLERIRSITNEK